MSYYQKYLKYKKKYTNLHKNQSKVQIGGSIKNISGPVSIWIGDYDQNRYILMGDVHFDITSHICPTDCMKIEDIPSKNSASVNYSENSYTLGNKVGLDNTCYEVTRLLDEIFNEALKTKQYIDFFHEIPFIYKGVEAPADVRDIYGNYLNKIDAYFSKCFIATKEKCEWKNYVRFHYTDIRLTYNRFQQIFFTADPYFLITADMLDGGNADIIMNNIIKSVIGHNYVVLMLQKYEKFNQIIFDSTDYTKDISDYFNDINNEMKKQCNDIYILDRFAVYISEMKKLFLQQVKTIVNPLRKNVNTSFIKKQMDELAKDNKFVYDKLVEFKNNKIDEMNIRLNGAFKNNINYLYIDSTKLKSNLMNLTDLTKLNAISELVNDDLATSLPIFTVENNVRFWQKTILKYGPLYMDIYLLSRLFRQFTSSNTHIHSKTKIIYAGALHIQSYIEFFQLYLKVSPEKFVGLQDINTGLGAIDSYRNASRCLESPYPEIKDFIKGTLMVKKEEVIQPIAEKEISWEDRKKAMDILDRLGKILPAFARVSLTGKGEEANRLICEIDILMNQLENQKQYIPEYRNNDLNKVLLSYKSISKSHKCDRS
ncbi:hypothetical protein Indivirus_6_49 [Indivirus ILV1]|uniref:Uncharacterized protein n=1 Tax=Indivirus ILV1 TaxID=1977633 RepID=A0A1V0SE44_9VIRU|nr:hypothetical protein Indivirus_6_49 [Indivirus ILV1]